jgi:hypothetical protein
MMSTLQIVAGACVAIGLAVLLWRQYNREMAKRADQGRELFEPVMALFDAPDVRRGETAGVWILTGRYRGTVFQLKTVTDTLATRKLPSLWLMVTLPQAQPVPATVDLMMRAAGLTSFSNFDFLPHTLELPKDFPVDATLRSDRPADTTIVPLLVRHLDLFHSGKGKEFLVSPKGLRIVVLLAEADRARYGVLREANFDGVTVDPVLARQVMDTLIELQNDIASHDQS